MPVVHVFYDEETGLVSGYGSSKEPGTVELDVPEDHKFLTNPGLFVLNEHKALEFSTIEDEKKKEEKIRVFQTEYLKETDWYVARHRDQLDLGITTTLTEEEFKILLQKRQDARDGILLPTP